MQNIETILANLSSFMWGVPLVVLLVSGGVFFMFHSNFLPYRHFKHALAVISGKYNDPNDSGDVTHFQALMIALSGTLGLGNIAGVAIAIAVGGPGAVFWMWVTAVIGVATKFYTASLAVMYRGYDRSGHLQGGPMYVIREAMSKKWMPLACLFALSGMIGVLPIFQMNQLVQVVRDFIAIPHGLTSADQHFTFDLIAGIFLAAMVCSIVIGKLQRIAKVASTVVPFMVGIYFLLTIILLIGHADKIPTAFNLIFTDAFTGNAAAGGVIGSVILIGVQRGAFSNEAGIGTESLAHGASKTNEPIREGLVGMMGPVVDTLIVCTCTALAILVTGVWQGDGNGVTLTVQAYEQVFPGIGGYILSVIVFFLSTSTVLSFWYYGGKCTEFLFGPKYQQLYVWGYILLIVLGAVSSLTAVISIIEIAYAAMAIPTMISTLILAPKVKQAAKDYFDRTK